VPNSSLDELHAINLAAQKGSVNGILGPVGCGKSTLMKTILGETKAKSGSISLRTGFIGFCAQDPWIQNSTVRENIIGPNTIDIDWYRKVIRVASLEKDFQQMPSGDSTGVGSRGLILSGGQKHPIVRI
jgi:ABC-type bacteriocin/lantibiotic exporter with double-glycine peptidase domain